MTYSIYPSDDGKYIITKIRGEFTAQIAVSQIEESHAMGNKLGISRYLVDLLESSNFSSSVDDYNLVHERMPNIPGANKFASVALVVNPDDHSHDFMETVSINAGLNLKVFRDRDLAIEYLLGK